MTLEEEDILRNWHSLKPLILAKWNKLRETDLEDVQPVLDDLVDVIQNKYSDMPKQSIIEDLKNLNHQILKP